MNIKSIDRGECTGCGLCAIACCKSAIKMIPDEEGFIYPSCDIDLCIDCGLCVLKCPTQIDLPEENPIAVYEAQAKQDSILMDTSSGGVFRLIAQKIIEENGCVYGAGYESDSCRVVHIRVDNKDDLPQLSDSKYVQSRMYDIYTLLERDLQTGKKVLFSGTPCQVHAVKLFADKKNISHNLILCDIVCHGCPSPSVYEEHISYLEDKYKVCIKNVKFRDKEFGWNKSNARFLKFISTTGAEYRDNLYYKLYFSYGVISRPVCEKCRYCSPNRVSDITIGDFWGNQRLTDNGKGISLCIINTSEGGELLSSIDDLVVLASSSIDIASKENVHLRSPVVFGQWRKSFWWTYQHLGYRSALRIFTRDGIIYSIIRRIVTCFR